jgi:hypothetical protein
MELLSKGESNQHQRLPEEYEKCLIGLNAITKEACDTAQSTKHRR